MNLSGITRILAKFRAAISSGNGMISGALVTVGLLVPIAQSDTSTSFRMAVPSHGRISVRRNDDGSLKLGLRNAVETSNWSGYSLENFSTGQTYSSASASWTVPKVTFQEPAQTCHTLHERGFSATQRCFAQSVDMEYSSTWVGIGGTCENANCTRTDNTLIQLGDRKSVAADGTTQYYAWYELLPRNSVVILSST